MVYVSKCKTNTQVIRLYIHRFNIYYFSLAFNTRNWDNLVSFVDWAALGCQLKNTYSNQLYLLNTLLPPSDNRLIITIYYQPYSAILTIQSLIQSSRTHFECAIHFGHFQLIEKVRDSACLSFGLLGTIMFLPQKFTGGHKAHTNIMKSNPIANVILILLNLLSMPSHPQRLPFLMLQYKYKLYMLLGNRFMDTPRLE